MTKRKNRSSGRQAEGKQGKSIFWAEVLEYAKAIALAVVLTLFIRAFVVQAFKIPSGSMIPTLLVGDRLLVSKFSYGLRSPFSNKILIETGAPQRGEVAVFIFPEDPSKDFIKRIIGLPGDKVEIRQKKLYINDQEIPEAYVRHDPDQTLDFFLPNRGNYGPTVVPADNYFVMGDNRDHSNDSRSWGMVSRDLLRGRAWRLYWSRDVESDDLSYWQSIRWSRMGENVD